MPYVYEGPVAVTVKARYLGLEPAELIAPEWPVRLLNAGPGRVRVELQHYARPRTGQHCAGHAAARDDGARANHRRRQRTYRRVAADQFRAVRLSI